MKYSLPQKDEIDYSQPGRWIKKPGELTRTVQKFRHCAANDYRIILCAIPEILPKRRKNMSESQMLFIEATNLMRREPCQIISSSSPDYFRNNCRDGYHELAEKNIWKNEKYINLSRLWYLKDSKGRILLRTRSSHRVTRGVIRQSQTHGGINFVLRPGSPRIGDSVAKEMLESEISEKVLVLDTESPIDDVLAEALFDWNRPHDDTTIYLSGNQFLDLIGEDLVALNTRYTIVLICLAQIYNIKSYHSMIKEVIKKMRRCLSPALRIWIAGPNINGRSLFLKDLASVDFRKDAHYTLILDISKTQK